MENSSLQMASMVQKRADEEVLKLIEDQKVSLSSLSVLHSFQKCLNPAASGSDFFRRATFCLHLVLEPMSLYLW
jgi:hypothetical protein